MKFRAHWSTVCSMTNSDARWDSNSVSQVCAALQRPIISKCQHSAKFGNTVHVKGSIPCPATYFRFSFRYWRKYGHFSTTFKTAYVAHRQVIWLATCMFCWLYRMPRRCITLYCICKFCYSWVVFVTGE